MIGPAHHIGIAVRDLDAAVALALRTQQILAHESGVGNTVDPAGGSYHLEALTDRIEEEASKTLAEVERRGGMIRAIETGWVQRQVADAAYRFQLELERGERTIVGVNAYTEGGSRLDVAKVDPTVESRQVARMRTFHGKRDMWKAQQAVRHVAQAAASEENVVPSILDAVKAGATLGEVSDILREVFGVYRPRNDA